MTAHLLQTNLSIVVQFTTRNLPMEDGFARFVPVRILVVPESAKRATKLVLAMMKNIISEQASKKYPRSVHCAR
jgi:hypothetical protein